MADSQNIKLCGYNEKCFVNSGDCNGQINKIFCKYLKENKIPHENSAKIYRNWDVSPVFAYKSILYCSLTDEKVQLYINEEQYNKYINEERYNRYKTIKNILKDGANKMSEQDKIKFLNSQEEVTKALQENKVVVKKFNEYDIIEYRLINGIICDNTNSDGMSNINPNIKFEKDKFYIKYEKYTNKEEGIKYEKYTNKEEGIKFEIPESYKTASGEKAVLYNIVNGAEYPFYFVTKTQRFTANIYGEPYNKDMKLKIIDYWDK